jgi:hypothetical protein
MGFSTEKRFRNTGLARLKKVSCEEVMKHVATEPNALVVPTSKAALSDA